jgi:hypothetical protein
MVNARGPKTGSVFLASLECLPGNQPVNRAQCEVLMNRLAAHRCRRETSFGSAQAAALHATGWA